MGQVTIYLDDDSESRLKIAAKAAGVSVSRWLSDLVKEKTLNEWPEHIKQLSGAWKDFPDLDEIRTSYGSDMNREDF